MKIARHHTPKSAALTYFILNVFKANGALIEAGDALVKDIGLTSARWQVMGAIKYSETPKSVSWIAHEMGVSRQAVQRIANDLVKAELASFEPNPHHVRSPLLILTDLGEEKLTTAGQRQLEWVTGLTDGMSEGELEQAQSIINQLIKTLNEQKSNKLNT